MIATRGKDGKKENTVGVGIWVDVGVLDGVFVGDLVRVNEGVNVGFGVNVFFTDGCKVDVYLTPMVGSEGESAGFTGKNWVLYITTKTNPATIKHDTSNKMIRIPICLPVIPKYFLGRYLLIFLFI